MHWRLALSNCKLVTYRDWSGLNRKPTQSRVSENHLRKRMAGHTWPCTRPRTFTLCQILRNVRLIKRSHHNVKPVPSRVYYARFEVYCAYMVIPTYSGSSILLTHVSCCCQSRCRSAYERSRRSRRRRRRVLDRRCLSIWPGTYVCNVLNRIPAWWSETITSQ